MIERITERSLYVPIIRLFEETAKRHGIRISGVQEVKTGGRYPDILIHIDGRKLLIQVKIGRISKITEDIVKSYPVAKRFNAELVGILFPSEVRRIVPTELNTVAPKLRVTRALILAEWMAADLENIELLYIAENIIKEFLEYKKTFIPTVNYLTIAKIARETIEELASSLRMYMGVEKYFDMAQAIIGRFDFYRSLLEEFVEKEEIMVTYIADIIAYLLVLQLLFSHIVSIKKYKKDILPAIDNPLSIPKSLITDIERNIRSLGIHEEYKGIIGSLPYLLEILKNAASQNKGLLTVLGRYIYAIKVLRPQHVKEELLGRIYQEGLPPETRKNLGAFFTNPRAAKLLAEIAIEKWNEKILDPACGSGTLLVAAYWAKMKRARLLNSNVERDALHEQFIKNHIVGIDIMQFARELTTINLAFQNIRIVNITPKIYYGDGIEKMIQSVKIEYDDPPTSRTLTDYIKIIMKEYEELKLPREGFDVVIMNPPFTRRERIPERERSKLEKIFGNILTGKVGYWAYFFAAADNVIRPYGKLAAVTPEEFFAGRSAESLRKYMLLGENSNYKYKLNYVIRSAVEVAFSEGAHYRDYLVVLKKIPKDLEKSLEDYMFFIILKRRKDELRDEDIEHIISIIREMERSPSNRKIYSSDLADIIKVSNASSFVERHINNLKPLVGFNCLITQKVFLELLNSIATYPSLGEISDLIIYNPGQYTAGGGSGIEDYARRLFISKYGTRGKVSFRFVEETTDKVKIKIRGATIRSIISLDKKYLKPSLRTLSGVQHIDLTGETEYVVTDINALKPELWSIAGFADMSKLRRAIRDVSNAYRDKASKVLVARRCRLTSSNVYWLAFYSEKPQIFTTSPFLAVKLERPNEDIWYKAITLYLNSAITLLQILGYFVETEGAWGTLHAELVWSNVIVPDFNKVKDDDLKFALHVFNIVSKTNVGSIYQRILTKDPIQRVVDEAALRLLGLHDWTKKLDAIYDAIKCELDALQKILDEGQKERKKRRLQEAAIRRKKKEKIKETNITPLDKWLKS